MKKGILFFLIALFVAAPLYADDLDGRTNAGAWSRVGIVMKRGLVNALTFPGEIIRTAKAEPAIHSRLWPVTFVPRAITNTIIRATSAVNDLVLFPWAVPFTNDLSPWTESFDLPVYVWAD